MEEKEKEEETKKMSWSLYLDMGSFVAGTILGLVLIAIFPQIKGSAGIAGGIVGFWLYHLLFTPVTRRGVFLTACVGWTCATILVQSIFYLVSVLF